MGDPYVVSTMHQQLREKEEELAKLQRQYDGLYLKYKILMGASSDKTIADLEEQVEYLTNAIIERKKH